MSIFILYNFYIYFIFFCVILTVNYLLRPCFCYIYQHMRDFFQKNSFKTKVFSKSRQKLLIIWLFLDILIVKMIFLTALTIKNFSQKNLPFYGKISVNIINQKLFFRIIHVKKGGFPMKAKVTRREVRYRLMERFKKE